MENSEKLLELLQKDKLAGEEQQQLNLLIQDDPELAKLYNFYKNIKSTVKYNTHPSTDEISEYILYMNKTGDNGTGLILAPLIEEHLRICKQCEEEFKELNAEYCESELYLDGVFNKSFTPDISELRTTKVKKYAQYKSIFITAMAVLVISLSAIIISNSTKPLYYDVAKLSDKSELSITRGRATDDFQKGIESYDEGNYNNAITCFTSDIKLNGNESTIFYTHYILGLTYLESAQKNILGLFPSFDKSKLLNGITNLKNCIQTNNSGDFQDINMNASFYMAKAYLMLGNKEDAVVCLKNVINGKGSKMDEAAEILNKLE